MIRSYPYGCESDAELSWPLYLVSTSDGKETTETTTIITNAHPEGF